MRKRYTAQNLYKTTLTNPVLAISPTGDGNTVFTVVVDVAPSTTLTEGFLIIDYNNPSKRDFIKFHSVSGSTFSYYRKDRDLLGTGAISKRHDSGAYVQINVAQEYSKHLYDNVDDFGYIEDFRGDDFKVYGGVVDTPLGQVTVSDTTFSNAGDGTWYIFFDYADNTFKKLASTTGYVGVSVATIVIASSDITSITDTRPRLLPTRYDPDVFEFGTDGELKLINNTTISDATTLSKGRVRLGTLTDHENAETGAVVVATENLVKTPDATPANDENKVPILNSEGYVDDFVSLVAKSGYVGASSAGSDSYAVTASPAITSYQTGYTYIFKADVANTGACSVDFGPSTKNIKTINGEDPLSGMIQANQFVVLEYDGTNMVLQNPSIPEYGFFTGTAGENITAGQPLRLANYAPGESIGQGVATGANLEFQYDATKTSAGQSFTVTAGGLLSSIEVNLRKAGTPTGTLTMYVYEDSDLTTAIATSTNTFDVSAFTTSFVSKTFNFSSEYLPAGTYRFKMTSNGANNTSNYLLAGENGNNYAGGTGYNVSNANSRADASRDIGFTLVLATNGETENALYRTDASFSYQVGFLGFAKETVTAGNSVRVDMLYNTNQTGLTPATTYYLSDTTGAIATSAGTNSKVVGYAVNATTIVCKY